MRRSRATQLQFVQTLKTSQLTLTQLLGSQMMLLLSCLSAFTEMEIVYPDVGLWWHMRRRTTTTKCRYGLHWNSQFTWTCTMTMISTSLVTMSAMIKQNSMPCTRNSIWTKCSHQVLSNTSSAEKLNRSQNRETIWACGKYMLWPVCSKAKSVQSTPGLVASRSDVTWTDGCVPGCRRQMNLPQYPHWLSCGPQPSPSIPTGYHVVLNPPPVSPLAIMWSSTLPQYPHWLSCGPQPSPSIPTGCHVVLNPPPVSPLAIMWSSTLPQYPHWLSCGPQPSPSIPTGCHVVLNPPPVSPLAIMWSSTLGKQQTPDQWQVNHFVVCVPRWYPFYMHVFMNLSCDMVYTLQ